MLVTVYCSSDNYGGVILTTANVSNFEVTAALFCVVMANGCAGHALNELQSRYCTVKFERERKRERERVGGRR